MTGSDNPLTPQQEEVRRLLAEARHTGPPPPDVVARLDRVLDDLAQEPGHAAPVVDLSRRRRRVASLLVAAAAVVAVGVGVGQVVSTQPASDSAQRSADSGALAESADEPRDGVQSKPQSGDARSNSANSPVEEGEVVTKSRLIEVRRDELGDDLTDLRSQLFAYSPQSGDSSLADRAAGAACAADSWGAGRFVPVRYGGTPAVLVFRRPVGDTQVADLFLCGSKEPVRSVTLPAP